MKEEICIYYVDAVLARAGRFQKKMRKKVVQKKDSIDVSDIVLISTVALKVSPQDQVSIEVLSPQGKVSIEVLSPQGQVSIEVLDQS